MKYDPRQLAMIISHASHHLHAVTGNVATALLDIGTTPRMLFSNSALSQVNGMTMVMLARDYIRQANGERFCFFTHELEDDLKLYLTILDEQHVFVVVGKAQDELNVQEFNERLKTLLPQH